MRSASCFPRWSKSNNWAPWAARPIGQATPRGPATRAQRNGQTAPRPGDPSATEAFDRATGPAARRLDDDPLAPAAGRLPHLGCIGEGGMGVVYEAVANRSAAAWRSRSCTHGSAPAPATCGGSITKPARRPSCTTPISSRSSTMASTTASATTPCSTSPVTAWTRSWPTSAGSDRTRVRRRPRRSRQDQTPTRKGACAGRRRRPRPRPQPIPSRGPSPRGLMTGQFAQGASTAPDLETAPPPAYRADRARTGCAGSRQPSDLGFELGRAADPGRALNTRRRPRSS